MPSATLTNRAVLHLATDSARAVELESALTRAHAVVTRAGSVREAIELFSQQEFDAVVADSSSPDIETEELIYALRERVPDLPVVVTCPVGDSKLERALAAGARDFVNHPFDERELVYALNKVIVATELERVRPPTASLPAAAAALSSPSMQEVMRVVERAAQGEATVLIRGESGTGKEVLAREIHRLGPRRHGPFMKVHCAALPETMLESELFGYERGAFTGAVSRKPGRFELSEGGTLFLDEIGDVSPAVQVKLLRVVQDREYEALGGTRTLKANVRVITATHRNLEQMVKTGEFREDLYYRLNVVRVRVPPLRSRRDDIAPLAMHFCTAASRANHQSTTLDPSAVAVLESAEWPGNVRQLQNVIERLVVLTDASVITAEHVKAELDNDATFAGAEDGSQELSVLELDAAVRKAERKALSRALRKANGNRLVAARILGISRRTLFYKLRDHGIS